MKIKRNAGLTLVEVLVASVLGLFLIAALFLIAGKGDVFYKITSTQNSLQQVGEYILNDISREVSGAQRVDGIDPDQLSLMYIPTGTNGTATTTYFRTQYYLNATTWYVTKHRQGSGIPTTNEYPLGDPRQLTNVEKIKFNYYDANGSVTNNAGVVKIVETVLILSSRKPDKTRQRLQLSAKSRLPRNQGIVSGYCNNRNQVPAKVKVDVYKDYPTSSLFASKEVAKNSDGAYIFSLPFSFTSQDAYSLVATPQTTDPYDINEGIYKATPLDVNGNPVRPPFASPHANFLLLPEYVQYPKNFIMEYDDTKFIATGNILLLNSTTTVSYDTFFSHKGPRVNLTVNPTGFNNYPNNTFFLWGTLRTINLTGGPLDSSVTIRIWQKQTLPNPDVEVGTGFNITTDSSGAGSTAPGAFAAIKLFSYTTQLVGFARIAAYRESSPGVWSYGGLAASELSGNTHRYYFEDLPKSNSVPTSYAFIFVREYILDPTEESIDPEVIYYIKADGSLNTVNIESAPGIGIEPGKTDLDISYIYAP